MSSRRPALWNLSPWALRSGAISSLVDKPIEGIKGWTGLPETQRLSLDTRLDRLADFVERHLDISLIDRLLEEGV
jgi:hypothetical protein